MLSQFDAFVLLFEALVIFFYLHGMHEVTAARASVRRVVRGDLSLPFWVGIVLVGLVIPFCSRFSGRASRSRWCWPASAAWQGGFMFDTL